MSEQTQQKPPQTPDTPAPAPRKRRWRFGLRAAFLVGLAPVLFAMIAFIALLGREVTAPTWIVRDVEARAAELLGGGSLAFGDIKLTLQEDFHPRLVLRNAELRDAGGRVIAKVPRIEGLISPRGVLQGRALAQEVVLTGAQINLQRRADGSVAVSFGEGLEVGAAGSLVELLEQGDRVFSQGALEALEQVSARGLILNYADARVGRSWVIDDSSLDLDLRGGETSLRANLALLSGRSFITEALLTYTSPRGSREAEIAVSITDAAAVDIGGQSPALSWLSVLDAPISGAMRARLDEDGVLGEVSATLEIGAGELRPAAATRPIPFQSARTYLTYDPARAALAFSLLEVDSAWGQMRGTAQTYLRDFSDDWPAVLLGQVQMSSLTLSPDDLVETPLELSDVTTDFRLRLDPFSLDIGQAVGRVDGQILRVSGDVDAQTDGWAVAVDVAAPALSAQAAVANWPPQLAPLTRDWLARNLGAGEFRNVAFAFRQFPGAAPVAALTTEFDGLTLGLLPDQPPLQNGIGTLSLIDRRFALSIDAGQITAPEGGRLDMAGSRMVIARTGAGPEGGRGAPAEFDLQLAGSITAAMSVLAGPPFNALANSDLPAALAEGQASISVDLVTPLGRGITAQDRVWSATADLRNLRSSILVPGRVLTATALDVRADADSLVIAGPVQMGNVSGTATFSRALGEGSQGTARLEADVALGPAFLEAFNIRLPSGMVSGQGRAALTVDLGNPEQPAFRLTSDLRGIGLTLAGVGWSKGREQAGSLVLAGTLGQPPRLDRFEIGGPNLQAAGTISLAAGGGLERAAFERVQLGGWLDAPVVLRGRGQGRPVAVQIAGGALDLRQANFGQGGGAGGEGGPLEIALDRLQITDGIALTDFRGVFASAGGLSGDFTGNLNGIAALRGTLVPVRGRSAVRIVSSDAGAVFRASGLLRNAFGGALDLTLLPAGAQGSYDGTLAARDIQVRDAPALASLLDAISVVGLLNQLGGQGLQFTEVDAQFRLTPSQIILRESSAIGPGLGLSMDGIYSTSSRSMDFQGVISPFFLLNGIGAILTRPGEGLIGFNFNLRGAVDSPQVLVNPLSALTPGMFREIFRRPPPNVTR